MKIVVDKKLAKTQWAQFILQAIPWQPEWWVRPQRDQLICHAVIGETILALRGEP